MKHSTHRAALAAKKSASLRSASAFSDAGVTVDMEQAVIKNAAVITVGRAKGHGFSIDSETLRQVAELINAKPQGVPVRFKHPSLPGEDGMMPDTLGTDVGYVRNVRVDGQSVRGDVYLGDYAEVLPGLGNVKDYLLRKAKSDPAGFGLSAVIAFDLEEQTDAAGNVTALVARVERVDSVDFVGTPAANPNGLLAAIAGADGASYGYQIGERAVAFKADNVDELLKLRGALSDAAPQTNSVTSNNPPPRGGPTSGEMNMDPKMKQCLSAHFGLAAGASDEDAQKMYDGMSAEQQADVKAKSAQMAAKAATNVPAETVASLATIAGPTHEAMLAAEGKRVTMLAQLGEALRLDMSDPADKAVVDLAIASGDDVPAARKRYLSRLQDKCKPVAGLAAEVSVGQNKRIAALEAALPQAIMLRAGQKVEKPHELATQLRNMTVLDMFREHLEALGAPPEKVRYLSRPALVDLLGPRRCARAFPGVAMLAQGSTSFDNVLLDAMNKTARQEYLLAPSTWNVWARRETAPDFKNINRVQLSDCPGLVARSQGGEIKYNVLSDSKETYVLAEYVNGLRLTRIAMVNDDLGVFSRIPRSQMQSAKQLEDDVCYAILTGNAALSDSGLLFNTTAATTAGGHANYSTSTAEVGAPSVTTLGTGRKKMRLQVGPKGNKLNLTPKFLLVPAALETVADQYTSAAYVAAVQTSINPFASNGRTPLMPVIEPRLDATSATAWYLAADNAAVDTVEVCFLQGEEEPVLKQESDFETEDMKFAVRHTVAAKAIDFRGLYQNAGA